MGLAESRQRRLACQMPEGRSGIDQSPIRHAVMPLRIARLVAMQTARRGENNRYLFAAGTGMPGIFTPTAPR
jgi:hypothetical protein